MSERNGCLDCLHYENDTLPTSNTGFGWRLKRFLKKLWSRIRRREKRCTCPISYFYDAYLTGAECPCKKPKNKKKGEGLK